MKKIVHCMHSEKFINPFIKFIESNFEGSEHYFIIRESDEYPTDINLNTILVRHDVSIVSKLISYSKILNKSSKIILHGLFHKELVIILFLQPWLWRRLYWIMWGGDLYAKINNKKISSKIYHAIKKILIRNIPHLVTYIPGDYDYAKKRYNAKGKYIECLMYESNIVTVSEINAKVGKGYIQVGNSGVPTNNHVEIFNKIMTKDYKNYKIIVPLSYGPGKYIEDIIKYGNQCFGEKFIPLTQFIPIDEYIKILEKIDIAIFNHRRQQGLGNTINLLGMGKTVFMNSNTTQYDLFKKIGIEVRDYEDLDINTLDECVLEKNSKIAKEYFAKDKLIKQYKNIFI